MPEIVQVDLTRAANAFGQMRVPLMWARATIFTGAAAFLVGLMPPVTVVIAGSGIFLLVLGFLALRLLRGTSGLARGATPFVLVLVGLLSVADGIFAMMPSATIVHPWEPNITEDMRRALAIANQRFGAPPFVIARSLAGSLMIVFGGGILRAAWDLLRMWRRPIERRLLDETDGHAHASWGARLADLSPGIMRHSRGDRLALAMGLLAAFVFLIASTGLSRSTSILNMIALTEVTTCMERGRPGFEACVDRAGYTVMLVMAWTTILWTFVTPHLGSFLARKAQRRAAQSAAGRLPLPKDKAPIGVLFLRSFVDDQGLLPRTRGTFIQRMLFPARGRMSVDRLLLEESHWLGIPRALGRTLERFTGFRPFGAVREYVPDETWQSTVETRAEQAEKIVVVFGRDIMIAGNDDRSDTGLVFELRMFKRRPELLAKAVFIAHPNLGRRITRDGKSAEYRKYCREVWVRAGELAGFQPPNVDAMLVSLRTHLGSTTVTTAEQIDDSTVRLALRASFPRASDAP